MLKVSVLQESTGKDCSGKTWLFLIEVIRLLQFWSISFFQLGLKEAGAKCIGHPVTIIKGENLCVQKRVALRFTIP